MNKFVAVYTVCSILVVLMAGQAAEHAPEEDSNPDSMATYNDGSAADDNEVEVEEELESEIQLKKMLSYVTPLMAIFQQQRKRWGKRSTDEEQQHDEEQHHDEEEDSSHMVETSRKRGRRPPAYKSSSQPDRMGSSYYGDYSSASSYGGGGYGCCDKKDDLLPILALTALSLLLLYLIAIATTTTSAAGRRRRRDSDDNLIEENQPFQIDLLDAPTWLSMVEELWNADDDETSDACALKALCRMNHLALEAPGSTGLAVSLSSVPLSYLLHHRHQNGFMRYIDASLMGRSGENCTVVFSSCSRLN